METGNWYLLVGRFISRPNGQIETVGVVANCWNLKLKRGSTQNNCWQTTSLLQNHRRVKTLHFTTPVFLLWLGWGTKGFGSHRVLAPAHRTSWYIYSEAPERALLQSPPVCFGSRYLFYCHKHGWKLFHGLLETSQKHWNTDLNSGHWLGSLFPSNCTTISSVSRHESQVINMYCECDMTSHWGTKPMANPAVVRRNLFYPGGKQA